VQALISSSQNIAVLSSLVINTGLATDPKHGTIWAAVRKLSPPQSGPE